MITPGVDEELRRTQHVGRGGLFLLQLVLFLSSWSGVLDLLMKSHPDVHMSSRLLMWVVLSTFLYECSLEGRKW